MDLTLILDQNKIWRFKTEHPSFKQAFFTKVFTYINVIRTLFWDLSALIKRSWKPEVLMFLIVNENGVSFTIYQFEDYVEVFATNEIGEVKVKGRTRKEAVRKARKKLREMTEKALFD